MCDPRVRASVADEAVAPEIGDGDLQGVLGGVGGGGDVHVVGAIQRVPRSWRLSMTRVATCTPPRSRKRRRCLEAVRGAGRTPGDRWPCRRSALRRGPAFGPVGQCIQRDLLGLLTLGLKADCPGAGQFRGRRRSGDVEGVDFATCGAQLVASFARSQHGGGLSAMLRPLSARAGLLTPCVAVGRILFPLRLTAMTGSAMFWRWPVEIPRKY